MTISSKHLLLQGILNAAINEGHATEMNFAELRELASSTFKQLTDLFEKELPQFSDIEWLPAQQGGVCFTYDGHRARVFEGQGGWLANIVNKHGFAIRLPAALVDQGQAKLAAYDRLRKLLKES